ncbi:MAG: methylenetetrahydrofolate reductase C-terminal domain-containing protein, partial [Candidatus Firestonebacteria bacterium]
MLKNDFTKYKLKPGKEAVGLLGSKDNIFIISCNKCFKQFVSQMEPEYAELAEMLKSAGKTLSGYIPVDYLCNSYLTKKTLTKYTKEIEKSGAVAVISCGLGIQTTAGLCGKPVLAMADSLYQGGYHGISLSGEKCGACGECYLTSTGGICPVVDCSKGLINGPCGGAKQGKCETSKEKNCAWEQIYYRLEKQGRTKGFVEEAPKLRNYGRTGVKFVNEYVKKIREKRAEGFYGGLYPFEHKEQTKNLAIEKLPEAEIVVIPLLQNAGAPCESLVKKGDKVKTGQKIGDTQKSPVSAPVHSSVSGEVLEVGPKKHPLFHSLVLSVKIKSDKKQELDVSVKPAGTLETLTKEQLLSVIREKGIVGMGGAQFPTALKLKSPKPVDTILINGCECEPLLNADYRIMVERSKELILGLKLIMKATGASKGVIAVEDNKLDAAEILKGALGGEPSLEIAVIRTKYPEGAERMLVKRVLGREYPLGGLPLEAGVVVNNVGTAYAVWDAVYNGMPLIKRVVTVAGENIAKKGNYEVLVGTPLKD